MQEDNISAHESEIAGKLFIGGLSWNTNLNSLRMHFEQFGECVDVALMIDKRSGKPRGFAFVKMKNVEDADRALRCSHAVDGRKVDVKRALPRDRAPGPIRAESGKLFVGGLHPSVGDQELKTYFAQFGPIKDAVVMIDRLTGNSRGFGFVTYHTEEAFHYTLSLEHTLMSKKVEVRRAEARNQVGITTQTTITYHAPAPSSSTSVSSLSAAPLTPAASAADAAPTHPKTGQYAAINHYQGPPSHGLNRLLPRQSVGSQRTYPLSSMTSVPPNHIRYTSPSVETGPPLASMQVNTSVAPNLLYNCGYQPTDVTAVQCVSSSSFSLPAPTALTGSAGYSSSSSRSVYASYAMQNQQRQQQQQMYQQLPQQQQQQPVQLYRYRTDENQQQQNQFHNF